MLASQILNQSLLSALEEAKNDVRRAPGEAAPRILLFQLLAVLGDWQKSLDQLEVCGNLDPAALAMVHAYREVLAGERQRSEVFAGQRLPCFSAEPPSWMVDLVRALQLNVQGQNAEAEELRQQSFQNAPAIAGTIITDRDKTPARFQWIADADSRLGPVLEVIIHGEYYWVPWTSLQAVHVTEPHDLRDVVWTPAYLEWVDGDEGPAFIPTRYCGSENADDELRLSRKTVWSPLAEQSYAGQGQRIFATDDADFALMTIRKIQLDETTSSTGS